MGERQIGYYRLYSELGRLKGRRACMRDAAAVRCRVVIAVSAASRSPKMEAREDKSAFSIRSLRARSSSCLSLSFSRPLTGDIYAGRSSYEVPHVGTPDLRRKAFCITRAAPCHVK